MFCEWSARRADMALSLEGRNAFQVLHDSAAQRTVGATTLTTTCFYVRNNEERNVEDS